MNVLLEWHNLLAPETTLASTSGDPQDAWELEALCSTARAQGTPFVAAHGARLRVRATIETEPMLVSYTRFTATL